MPDELNQEQDQQQTAPESNQQTQPKSQSSDEEVIRNPQAVLKTIEALRSEIKSLKSAKGETASNTPTIPPEITAELDRLRKFAADKETEEKERQRKELEARGQYEALLRDARAEAEKQTNALKEKAKHLETELQKRESAIAERETILRDYRLRTAARDAFFAQGGRRGDESQGGDFYFNLVWENAVKGNLNEGENGIEVVDGDSLLLDEEKRPVDLQGLMKLRKTAYGFAFEGEPSSSGSGKPPSNVGRATQSRGKLVIPSSALSNRSAMLNWAKDNGIDAAKITSGIQTGEIVVE